LHRDRHSGFVWLLLLHVNVIGDRRFANLEKSRLGCQRVIAHRAASRTRIKISQWWISFEVSSESGGLDYAYSMAELEAFTGFGVAIVCLVRANESHSACVVVPVPTKSVVTKASLVTKAMKSLCSSNESLPACESYLPSRDEAGASLRTAQIALTQDIHSLSQHRKIQRTHHQR
jgi:hypothetical protein